MNITKLSGIAGIAFYALACNDAKKTDTVTTENDTVVTTPVATVAKNAASEGNSVTIEASQVPDTIRTGFVKEYPKAQNIQWIKYEPVETDDLPMDDNYYYVRFNNNGADYVSWYNNRGNWVKTSTRVPGNSRLPDPVNLYINNNYAGYQIEEINKENDKDMELFEIKLNKGESKVKIKILPTGEIVKRKVK